MIKFKNKYRIVKDRFAGYEVQIRRWWFPFWLQANYCNTHSSIDKAEEWAVLHASNGNVVKNLGRLP